MKKFFIGILTILIVVGGGIFYFLNSRGSSETSTKYNEFSFISEGEDIDKKDFDRIDGQFYLSLDYINDNIDDTAKYEKNENTVIFTNEKGTRRYKLDEKSGLYNSKKVELRDPIIEKNGKIMIPIEAFIYDYPVELRYNKDKKLLLLDRKDVEYSIGTPTGNGLNIREKDSKSSPVVKSINKEDKVYVYGEVGDFYRVREKNGFAGYIKKNLLDVEYGKDKFKKDIKNSKKEAVKPLNLTWDYTYGPQKQEEINLITNISGLDIICPTWFSIQNKNGDIIDRGNMEYVNKYNNLGIDVWGYLDNSFDKDITHEVLSSSALREKVIAKTLELTKSYNMKGINIDFEQTNIDDRDNITQFVREMSSQFRANGIKVSVDVTPQITSDVTKEPYNRKELAEAADYVVVMAYDQHWSSSKNAGSVAQYKWVEGNINMLFRQIPTDKMILGVPFYSRIWTEENGSVKSQTLTMAQANKIISDKNLKVTWDDVSKQDYTEYTEGNKKVKIWLEDSNSIDYKVSLVNKYSLAGVGSWRKGFETQDVWETINSRLK